MSPAPEDANGDSPKYILSPNDLIYLPTAKEVSDGEIHFPIDRERVYKTVSATGNRCFFIKAEVAKSIVDKMEFSSMNKMERAITREEEMIKETCLPLKIDRLGNIIKIGDFKPE